MLGSKKVRASSPQIKFRAFRLSLNPHFNGQPIFSQTRILHTSALLLRKEWIRAALDCSFTTCFRRRRKRLRREICRWNNGEKNSSRMVKKFCSWFPREIFLRVHMGALFNNFFKLRESKEQQLRFFCAAAKRQQGKPSQLSSSRDDSLLPSLPHITPRPLLRSAPGDPQRASCKSLSLCCRQLPMRNSPVGQK